MKGFAIMFMGSWLQAMPKVELHLHLEGAIPLPALWELVRKYGGESEVDSPEALEARFRYRDFPHFLQVWVWKNGFLRDYEDFVFIAEAVAGDLARQNILYAEAFFSPTDFPSLEPLRLAEAIRRGLARQPSIEVNLVADLVRDTGPERGMRTLDALKEGRSLGIVGVGIGGAEHQFPPEPFAPVFEEARRLGFRTSAHAGEAAGPQSVWGALRKLRVDRIGHGTRAIEDERLVEYLVEHRIPVEVCPLSNLKTGATSALDRHPVRRLFDLGVSLSINTDDPAMFGTSLALEFEALCSCFQFTRGEIRALTLQAARDSWASESQRRGLVTSLEEGFQALVPASVG